MAYYNNRKEPVEEVETPIWSCLNDECSGWMREDYSFEQEPTCPLCQSEMEKDSKVLPKLS
ncbi:Cold-inducible protein YdjO [Amphibacillus marinus]|uniref:Cold-inducible protein YdjO n=1 Tax=Amphibacillus marinus TaxID=872970 RepID=A0A1H8QWF3_9BACI|nr:cold-shock protein [Amphibacillus marinus]SEO58640.1 Cold-inducible protein YdjO [Amphibacillus marinus]